MKQYLALYRENRPETFSEVLGQEHIVKILRHQIATETVGHAYLFCGTRGTGKTTVARILAKALNCTGDSGDKPCGVCPACRDIAAGKYVDVMEMDAASNNGVDDVRNLRESVYYPPVMGKKKVYIIDEVHMMSSSAFNAFLKTLEEPPEHVVFILATTDPEKLPATVLSRCMRLDFKRVSNGVIRENLQKIAADHGVTITDGALSLLAANADGSVRDSLSILERCLSTGEEVLDRDEVLEFLGIASSEFYLELTEMTLQQRISDALLLLEKALGEGKDPRQLMRGWMEHYRSLLIAKYVKNPQDMLNMSLENIQRIQQQTESISLEQLNQSIITLSRSIRDAQYSTQPRVLLEVAIVSIAMGENPSGTSSGTAPAPAVTRKAEAPRKKSSGSAPSQAEPDPWEEAPLSEPPWEEGPTDPPPWAVEEPAPASRRETGAAPSGLGASRSDVEEPQRVNPFLEDAGSSVPPEQRNPWGGEDVPEPTSPAAPPSSPEANRAADLAELWQDVIDAAEGQGGLGAAMRRAQLVAMNDREFKLLVDGPFAQNMLKREEREICALMERCTGQKRAMAIRDEAEKETDVKEDRAHQTAREAASVLGVKVDVR